jgi:hypothetical protein
MEESCMEYGGKDGGIKQRRGRGQRREETRKQSYCFMSPEKPLPHKKIFLLTADQKG